MQALDAARELLPAWVPWLPLLLWVPAAALVTGLAASLGAAIALGSWRELPPDAHWTERARTAHPAGRLLLLVGAVAAGLLAAMAATAGGPFAAVPPLAAGLTVGAASWGTGAVLRARLWRRVRSTPLSGLHVARDDGVLAVLLVPHLLVTAPLMAVIRAPLGPADAAALVLGALLMVLALRGEHVRALAAVGLAGPAPPELEGAVARAAERAGQPSPSVWLVQSSMANAFAFPLAGRLAFTSRAAEVLEADELRAVAAHELGHLAEPWPVRLLRAAAVLAFLPLALAPWAVQTHGGLGLAALLTACLSLAAVTHSLSQRLEARADAHAHAAEEEPGTYARALEHLYEANGTPAVLGGRRPTHPHLYDRLVAAGAPPSYPRPAAPPRLRAALGFAVALGPLVLLAGLLAGLPVLLRPAATESLGATSWMIGLADGADPLLRRARLHEHRHEPEPALAFARAAQALEPWNATAAATLAMLLGNAGLCAEADAQAARAEALAPDPQANPWVLNASLSAAECRQATAGG